MATHLSAFGPAGLSPAQHFVGLLITWVPLHIGAATPLTDPTQPPAGAVKRSNASGGSSAANPTLSSASASTATSTANGVAAGNGAAGSAGAPAGPSSTALRSSGQSSTASSASGSDLAGHDGQAGGSASASASANHDPNRLQMIVRGPGELRRARFGGKMLRVGDSVGRNGTEATITRITDYSVELRSADSTEIVELLPPLIARQRDVAASDDRLRARP